MIAYILIAAGIFAGDFCIKRHIEKTRKLHETTEVLKGRAAISRYHNGGAFLNLGESKGALVRALSVGLTAAAAVLFVCTLTRKGNSLLKTGLSLLLGGAFSNTYDRFHYRYVVDYFSFRTGIKALDRVVFNLADFAIMIGALCAALGA